MIRTEEEHLAHYGILRRSGRYPWGSGSTQSQRNRSYLDSIDMLRKEGMSETEIARGFGITTTQLRAVKSIALAQQKQEKILTAQRLRDKGWGYSEIGRRMSLNESSVRALLAPGAADKSDALQTTANMLRDQVKKNSIGVVDVGKGVENQVGITRSRLDTSIAVLKEQGYETFNLKIPQVGQPGQFTVTKVLAKPGTDFKFASQNRAAIGTITDHTTDTGRSFIKTQSPVSVDSKRIQVNYAEDGGAKADGVIYARRGVEDLSIGSSNYAQVRIAVDGTHYMKGMVVYKDDLPKGVDLVYNTNKHRDVPLKSKNKDDDQILKPMSDDPDLPFGAIVRQVHGPDGKVSSVMNRVGSPTKEGSGEEGQWDTWSRNLPSQMLSKQSPTLARQQLNVTHERRLKEFDEINSLTNPTVRKELLNRFADDTDAAAVHLQAAALPRQSTKVLLPIPSMKPTEVYAPSMRNGERVALIRFPHGGTFEIPELTVNNRNREARRIMGTAAQDAIGIHHSVAQHLSGADFDGDFVLVIPNGNRSVKSTPALEGLKDFDPQTYKIPKGSPIPKIDSARKQNEMGRVSNLITDMTLRGAPPEHLARAIKHSMVVIDSEKHGLDWKQSEKDHGILALKEEYQGGKQRGASTLISRAGAEIHIPEKKLRLASQGGPVDPRTGEKVFVPTGRMIPEKKKVIDPVTGKKKYVETGKMVPKTVESKQLAETTDAFSLASRPTPLRMERIYAEHSNRLKALANQARKEAYPIKGTKRSPSAAEVYSSEVESLTASLNLAKKNAPLERQAQRFAGLTVSQKRQANPGMEESEIKKIRQLALNEERIRTGAHKTKIKISPKEWEAIQAGAISNHKLEEILTNSDLDTVKTLAMPKHTPKLTPTKMLRARSMLDSGYTQAEVADALGVGLTTLKLSLSE